MRIQGPSGCRAIAFNVRVTGASLARVEFFRNGVKFMTLTRPNRGQAFVARIDPRKLRFRGYRITARATAKSNSFFNIASRSVRKIVGPVTFVASGNCAANVTG